MKAYLAIKFKEDNSNQQLIKDISNSLRKIDVETYVMARDFEKWGDRKNIEPDVLVAYTFKAIDECDFAIVEFSEKGVGLGIEAGYAFAKIKPVVVIAKEGSEISATLLGVAKTVIFYTDFSNLNDKLKELVLERNGVAFLIMRPDKKVLMQLRDGNSKRYKNMWAFPGGACDEGEEYIDAVIREAYEEYNLILKKEDCTFLMARVVLRMHVFICKIDDKQQPVLNEGADMKWMSIDEIKKLTIGYNQSDIVNKLEQYLDLEN